MGEQAAESRDIEAQIRTALAGDPGNPGLLAALGGLRLQAGDLDAALDLFARALGAAPDDPRILCDYGAALTMAGRLDEAEALLQSGLLLADDDNLRFNLARCLFLRGDLAGAVDCVGAMHDKGADAWKLEGDARRQLNDTDGAMRAYVEALGRDPHNPVYLNDLGVLLETTGDPARHRELWRQLTAQPDASAVAFYFYGNALRFAGDFAGARAAFERAVAMEPLMAEAYNNLALVLGKLGLEDEAREALARATRANPNLAAARSNLGAIMSRGSVLDEAEAMLAEAVRLAPDSLDARTNYAAVLMRQRRFAEAKAELRRVLAAEPGFASAELNMGLTLLTEGRLDEGWPYYESRWKQPQLAEKRPPLASPPWTGEVLDGRTLFIFAEQGFGDNLQFIRYALLLKARYPGARLVHYALHALVDLLRASPVGEICDIVPWGQPIPEHDFHCPVMSLPWRYGTVLANIPDPGPYLAPSVSARGAVAALPAGLRVGLVWASSETFVYRSAKTVALAQLLPLFTVPGVVWVNLQFGKEAAEIAENGLAAGIIDPMSGVRSFDDTAAIVAQLDLVISVDTAVAHLAGAMGRPVWMIDRFDTDWRWLPDREDSPWYRRMRIFRQREMGGWSEVVDRVMAALRHLVDNGGGQTGGRR